MTGAEWIKSMSGIQRLNNDSDIIFMWTIIPSSELCKLPNGITALSNSSTEPLERDEDEPLDSCKKNQHRKCKMNGKILTNISDEGLDYLW